MEKREPTLLSGMQIGVAAMENSKAISQKSKNRTSSFTVGYLSEWNWKHLFGKIHASPVFIAAFFTIAKVWKQPKCPLNMNGRKCDLYTMEYYSAIKTWNFVLCSNMDECVATWMNLKWNKSDRNKYCMILLTCGF